MNNIILEKDIIKIIKKIFKKTKNITLNSRSQDIKDWDSMNHIMMIMQINKFYKINISLEDSIKIDSIKMLIKVVKNYNKKK
jgi:acyl carrier protein